MATIAPCPVPVDSLLDAYRLRGAYTDCFATQRAAPVSMAEYVAAFYTTPLFKVERLILRLAIRRPSTDAEAEALAQGRLDAFAAWTVEGRRPDELLMGDLYGRTRSWLKVEPVDGGAGTRLYFGSAVVPAATGGSRLGSGFSLMLGFHRLYSRALLGSALVRLRSRR